MPVGVNRVSVIPLTPMSCNFLIVFGKAEMFSVVSTKFEAVFTPSEAKCSNAS